MARTRQAPRPARELWVSVRFTLIEFRLLNAVARQQGLSRSELVRRMTIDELVRHRPSAPSRPYPAA